MGYAQLELFQVQLEYVRKREARKHLNNICEKEEGANMSRFSAVNMLTWAHVESNQYAGHKTFY